MKRHARGAKSLIIRWWSRRASQRMWKSFFQDFLIIRFLLLLVCLCVLLVCVCVCVCVKSMERRHLSYFGCKAAHTLHFGQSSSTLLLLSSGCRSFVVGLYLNHISRPSRFKFNQIGGLESLWRRSFPQQAPTPPAVDDVVRLPHWIRHLNIYSRDGHTALAHWSTTMQILRFRNQHTCSLG